jgi:acyl carrier protein
MHPSQAEASLRVEVVKFVCDQLGVKPRKVTLDSRLNLDLGVDGDDAVEFYNKFKQRFAVDFENLLLHWDQHFAPEGGPGFGFAVLVIACSIGFDIWHWYVRPLPLWVWFLCLIALPTALIFRRVHRQGTHDSGVSVQDLVDAAEAHRWITQYN